MCCLLIQRSCENESYKIFVGVISKEDLQGSRTPTKILKDMFLHYAPQMCQQISKEGSHKLEFEHVSGPVGCMVYRGPVINWNSCESTVHYENLFLALCLTWHPPLWVTFGLPDIMFGLLKNIGKKFRINKIHPKFSRCSVYCMRNQCGCELISITLYNKYWSL